MFVVYVHMCLSLALFYSDLIPLRMRLIVVCVVAAAAAVVVTMPKTIIRVARTPSGRSSRSNRSHRTVLILR